MSIEFLIGLTGFLAVMTTYYWVVRRRSRTPEAAADVK
jgi:hypothetical protein